MFGAWAAPHWEKSGACSKYRMPQSRAMSMYRRSRVKSNAHVPSACSAIPHSCTFIRSVPTGVSKAGVNAGRSKVVMPFSAAFFTHCANISQNRSEYTTTAYVSARQSQWNQFV